MKVLCRWVVTLSLSIACLGCPDGAYGAIRTVPDLRYANTPGVDANLQSLDIYLPDPAPANPMPVVIWVHGGGWKSGDKASQMQYKPPLITGAGYCFVSINYRLSPDPPDIADPGRIMYPVHEEDVAAAIAWVHAHISEYGGDPARMALMGHSAGAHLVAIVSTDEAFLAAHSLPLTIIRGTASLDTKGYDVFSSLADDPESSIYLNAFGDDPLVWAAASPMNHVATGKGIPSFLLASRGDASRKQMCADFAAAVQAAGSTATIVDASVYSHGEVNQAIGVPGETVITPPLMAFFAGIFATVEQIDPKTLTFTWRKSRVFDPPVPPGDPLPTNGMNLAALPGQLFAGMSSDHEEDHYSNSSSYVYRKDSSQAPWVLDVTFEEGSGRVGALERVRFEHGEDGQPLSGGPIEVLLAGTNHEGWQATVPVVRVRQTDGSWASVPLGSVAVAKWNIRAIYGYRDRLTGADRVFVGVGPYPLGIFSGVVDSSAPGGLRFGSTPEIQAGSGNGKWFGMASANQRLYAANNQGIYERSDGINPAWTKVIDFPPSGGGGGSENNIEPRGLAAVPSIGFPEDQMLLFSRMQGMWRARAGGDYQMVMELDLDATISQAIGYPVGLSEAAFNPLVAFQPQGVAAPFWMIGIEFVFGDLNENHAVPPLDPETAGDMSSRTTFSSIAHYLVRYQDGSYSSLRRLVDPADPNRLLQIPRDMAPSPFADEPFGVYATGFNASSVVGVGGTGINGRAWIYQGQGHRVSTQDADGDGYPDDEDAFPTNPREWADEDVDGLGDNFEQTIIDYSTSDAIETLDDVLPGDDLDGDGRNNLREFQDGTDPMDPESRVPITTGTGLMLVTMFLLLSGCARTKAERILK